MAEITPVTREEFYLAKAGGQDVSVPSAVTREEHYLEKLSNDSVVVPSPVTRREKFLYFACGGEIDLPSEERMTRLERLIAKAGGMDVATPTAVTRLEKFWANVEGGGWKVTELTGALPITFRSNGTALINYRIYGTVEGAGAQTENLADMRNSGMVQVTGTAFRYGVSWGKLADGNYTISFKATGGTNLFITTRTGRAYSSVQLDNTTSVHTFTVNNADEVIFRTSSSSDTTWSALGVSDVMLTKGSTPPETYIPHGYKLPITVTSGADSKDTEIFIGDSKLLSGDYVDYESGKIVRNSTPQDPPLPLPKLETFNGENTLDSTETLGEVTITGMIKEAE